MPDAFIVPVFIHSVNLSPAPGMSDPVNQAEAILQSALQLPSGQRTDFIREACGSDDSLYQSVIESLATPSAASATPSAPRPTIVLSLPLTEKAGNRIGRYKLLEQIGEGGCGVVYVAEQEEPVRRRAALKVIKLGMDTRSVIARFEAERQALAMMDHPNIAKVLDAGATDTGRPYFVMELVRGIKITEYCDQNKLPTHERLNLFLQVCHAIQHAHQKGIIHRDIKPSNILVTLHDGVPVPKVIDFGIAKATQGRLTEKTVYTAFEQFIGTPAYMSPEQAEMSGLDVDTRSDIYALGVLLYELLTGQTPFNASELLKSGLDELRRTIREKEPDRPSTRLSTMLSMDLATAAQRRHSEPPKLIHALRGDLDWIVMKTLEKDRTRRYETANALAEDIKRHLNNEPVTARPPSNLYRFQKLVRRNKTLFASIVAGLAVLILGFVISLYLYLMEKAALQRALAAEHIESQLRQQAEKSAELSQTVARAGLPLMRGQYDEAERLLRDIPPHASLVPFYNVLGGIHARRGEWQEALTNWNRVVTYAPHDHLGYHYLAPLLIQMQQLRDYQQTRARILQLFGNTTDSLIAERMVKACLILPASPEEMNVISKMADVAAPSPPPNDISGFNLFAKALTEYRLGHFPNAIQLLEQVFPTDVDLYCRTESYLLLSMARYQLHQIQKSREAFAKATDAIDHQLPKPGHLAVEWNDSIIINTLLQEARHLFQTAI